MNGIKNVFSPFIGKRKYTVVLKQFKFNLLIYGLYFRQTLKLYNVHNVSMGKY